MTEKNRISRKKNNKELILSRLKFAHNFKTDTDLAHFLGVSPNTITTWKMRDSLNFDLVFAKCDNLNYDWLLTGEGEMIRSSAGQNSRKSPQSVQIIGSQIPENHKKVAYCKLCEEKNARIEELKDHIFTLKKLLEEDDIENAGNAVAG